MAVIEYNESTIVNARNRIDTCNNQILDIMKKVYEETSNISNILDTTKANKNIAEYLSYFNDRINYVNRSRDAMNRKLTLVETEYKNYFNEVGQMVGGNNG